MPASRIARRPLFQFALCAGLLAGLLGTHATAGDFGHFPGAPTDKRTQRIQEQVEELYDQQEFERALLIYERELAPHGDKYAQYMVGYMTLTGLGTEENPPLALAWYRLAAERDGNPYVQAREALAASLDADAIREADALFADLRDECGDRRVLLELLRADLAFLERYDRLPPEDLSNGTLVSGFLSASARMNSYHSIRERIESRLAYLGAVSRETASPELQRVEERIREEVAALPDL